MKQALKDILDAGLELWATKDGQGAVTSRKIAAKIGKTHAAVVYYFPSAEDMRAAIAKHAVDVGDATVICKLIASDHSAIGHMTTPVRTKWLASLRTPAKSG